MATRQEHTEEPGRERARRGFVEALAPQHPANLPPDTARDFPEGDPQVMYELARERLSTQLSFVDAVDSKISVLVSLASALLGIVAAVYALRAGATGSTSSSLSGGDIATLAVGGAIYLVIADSGLSAYFVRRWNVGPSLDSLWERHERREPPTEIKWRIANDTMYDFERNEPVLARKAFLLGVVLVGVVLESLVLVSALSLVAAGA